MEQTKKYNLATFYCLYIAQNIPMSFFSTVIPVMMRQEEFSLSSIGMLQLMKLPWILKFLWSTIVDGNSRSVTDYKRWIITSEIVYAFLIFGVAFLDFKADFITIMICLIMSFMASATQDIATDALAVRSFLTKDKSLINSMQSMGSFSATLIGGGLLLILFRSIGWNAIIPFLGVFVLLAILPLIFNNNIVIPDSDQIRPKARKRDVLLFFTQKGIWKQIVFLFLYYSGIIGTLAMLKPYLVDLGYNMHEIGIMSGIIGTVSGFIASFCGGLIVRRIGVSWSRILFAVMTLFTTAYFWILSLTAPSTFMLNLGIILLWGSYGLSTIVVYTTSMNMVRSGREGTDFTLQTVVTHISGILMAVFSGKIADMTGYSGLFAFETAIALVSFLYVIWAFGLRSRFSLSNK